MRDTESKRKSISGLFHQTKFGAKCHQSPEIGMNFVNCTGMSSSIYLEAIRDTELEWNIVGK